MNTNTSEINNEINLKLLYLSEAKRKKTFTSWIFKESAKCNASAMAEAGFIFMGNNYEPDTVKCFLCGKQLDCWDEDDDPLSEHLKHSSNCTFAKLGKPENALTLIEFVDIRNELIEKIVKDYFKKKTELIDKAFKELAEQLINIKPGNN